MRWIFIPFTKDISKEKIIQIGAIFFIAVVLFFSPVITVDAASLEFSPSTVSKTINNTFVVSVYVLSPDQAMNAVSGVFNFPKDKLQVISIGKTSSIVDLWVKEPSFSNTAGTVSFEGVVLNPGYTGNHGDIITITFKAKSVGQATLAFITGDVLANDGQGTNILDSFGKANYLIKDAEQIVPLPTPISSPPPVKINSSIINSPTHPNQTFWYVNPSPKFEWLLPDNVLEVRTLIGELANAVPSVYYAPPISEKKVDDLPDGAYYFSLQMRRAGGWGEIYRHRVNIDTTAPNPFAITFPNGLSGLDSQPAIHFNASDDWSGVKAYELRIDDGKFKSLDPSAVSDSYLLPPQNPGTHTIVITAIDEAGNKRSASENFVIEALETPEITYYQKDSIYGDPFQITGKTYPDSNVLIRIRDEKELVIEERGQSDAVGNFVIFIDKSLNPGIYSFTAQVSDERRAKSRETEEFKFVMTSRKIVGLVNVVLDYLSLVILLILVIAGIIISSAYAWFKSIRIIRHLRKKSSKTERALQKAFKALERDIKEHGRKIKTVKSRRKLTSTESEFLDKIVGKLDKIKADLLEKIHDISDWE